MYTPARGDSPCGDGEEPVLKLDQVGAFFVRGWCIIYDNVITIFRSVHRIFLSGFAVNSGYESLTVWTNELGQEEGKA